MKKVLIGLAALIVGAVVTYEVIQIGGPKGDPAKGIVKSPPPDKNKSNCPEGIGEILITESQLSSDVGKIHKIDSSDIDVCENDRVCVHISGPANARKVKIKKHCR
jgi:hypothetical protein